MSSAYVLFYALVHLSVASCNTQGDCDVVQTALDVYKDKETCEAVHSIVSDYYPQQTFYCVAITKT